LTISEEIRTGGHGNMYPKEEDYGFEKSEFADEETGRTIWRITNSENEEVHTYYDRCPWSFDGRYILFASANPNDLSLQGNVRSTQNGAVYLMDTQTYRRIKIAERAFYHSHQGSEQVWNYKKNKVYFYLPDLKVGVINVRTNEIEPFKEPQYYRFFGLSPDGEKFVFDNIDSSKLEGRGIYIMNEDCSDIRLIASAEELYRLSPYKDAFDKEKFYFGLSKWSPNGKYIATLIWVDSRAGSSIRGSTVILSEDGAEKYWLSYVGHHHSFTSDSKKLIWGDWKDIIHKSEPRITMINRDGTDKHFVVDEPYAGHPVTDPSSNYILTSDDQGVVLIDIKKRDAKRLCVFNPRFNQSHAGTHPHCAWNHNGTQIIYNSAQTGKSQLYVIPLK